MEEKRKGIILDHPMERYVNIYPVYPDDFKQIKIIYKWEEPSSDRKDCCNFEAKITRYKDLDDDILEEKSLYKFGDVLSLYGTTEKCIFVCQIGRFIYTCPFDSLETFTGMNRYTKENITGNCDKLSDDEKKILLDTLKYFDGINKHIPKKVKSRISRL